MRARLSTRPSSLPRTYLMSAAASWLVLLALAAAGPVQTPVDLYQDVESGKDGDLLTPELVSASCHGGAAKWSVEGKLWVSTKNARALPAPVVVGGKVFAGTEATRTWMFKDSDDRNYVECQFAEPHPRITVAGYYTPGVTIPFANQFDTIALTGMQAFAVLQTRNDDRKGPYLRGHSCTEGWKTTFSPDQIKIVPGKTYWVNLHFDGEKGEASVAAFDPEKGFEQVGETVVAQSWPGSAMLRLAFGRYDRHGDNPKAETQSYFGQFVVDYTKGAFPLLPQPLP
jgi:hypothetical protein